MTENNTFCQNLKRFTVKRKLTVIWIPRQQILQKKKTKKKKKKHGCLSASRHCDNHVCEGDFLHIEKSALKILWGHFDNVETNRKVVYTKYYIFIFKCFGEKPCVQELKALIAKCSQYKEIIVKKNAFSKMLQQNPPKVACQLT